MTKKEAGLINKKLENVFYNYYKKIGFLDNEENLSDNYLNKFLRERFIERVLFTVLREFEMKSLAEKSILITGFSHELVSFFLKLGAEPQNITVADICPQAIDRAKAILSKTLSFVKIDLDTLNFNDNTFDIAVCLNYLSNIPSDDLINKMAVEFYRVLKQGGLALVSFTNEIASHDDIQMSGVMRVFRPEEVIKFFNSFKLVNLLDFIPCNFTLFSINEESIYPKRIGIIEDLLIEQEKRYTDSLLLLSK
ncbi:class I SAM-dependent methyltransferase [Pelotomaculum terephthalicicum JT]|uniref:class I SAM-dependent methyltransferase n=1 Tax=Pelotomaculum TaxID=191373 RepID=UPI0009C57C8A|nr:MULTISPECIES: class I SAM-dependent methyltransferase [Pelotomaculum]MCG9967996.1 class I SAM-dependent methyltransferase [Pelotomaculum terephthalicicum JT]OPY63031.1 MAG: Ubiquinone/menaquinone biosynthesis C-methyltransferase UbiE [Pelotomaculum sp. PtaU1.Bin065]